MPHGVWKIINIPADKVDRVVAQFQLDGPKVIEKIEQSDGKGWTVKAVFPGDGETVKDHSRSS